ncbi:MAG: HAD-IIA family hydrolase [Chloroflexi bacterium]|nr:HAD-IIA family hydrolase [Chloroflexota bacterium]
MDGVLWLGNQAMPGLVDFIATLHRLDIRFILATNNASKSGEEFIAKLAGMGASIALDEILTSPQATASYLAQHAPNARIFTIGEPGLASELTSRGLIVVPQDHPDGATHVVVGWDRQLTYAKLAEACLLIRAGAVFIGTNPDVTYPEARGIVPGNGATLAALRVATDVEPIIIGKPQPEMMVQAMQRMGSTPANTAALGDRLNTDILGGQNAGLTTLLVMSGVTSAEHLKTSPIQPDYVFADIREVAAKLLEANRTG